MSLGDTPHVSFLLAVYNDARFLPETLQSLFAQTFRDFEIVVIDDASTDATAEILQSTGDPRLRYFRNEENLGQVPSLNRGLKHCRGELIARIDGDDLCEPDRLAAQVEHLAAHPSMAGCATWTTEIDVHGVVQGATEPCGDPEHVRWSMCHTLRLYHPSMMVRRRVYEEAGGYDQTHPATEDYELWTRLVGNGSRLGIVPRRLIRYRRREGSISHLNHERQRRVGHQLATRYTSQILGHTCEEPVVVLMRDLLSWTRLDPAVVSARSVAEALRLMKELRTRVLSSACKAARAAADEEVAEHLTRHGRLLLKDAPDISARLGLYVARLPGHRGTGSRLAGEALRCLAGRTRARVGRRLMG